MIRPHSFASCHDFRGSNTRWLSHPTRPTILGPSGVQRSAIIRVWPEIWWLTSYILCFQIGIIISMHRQHLSLNMAQFCSLILPYNATHGAEEIDGRHWHAKRLDLKLPYGLSMAAKKGIWQTERGFHLIYRDVCQNFGIYHDLRPNMFFSYRISFLFQLVIWTNTRLRYRLCFHHNFQLCNFSINYFGVAMRIYILFNIIYIYVHYIL